ncbi:MAG: FG-GAP repeat domain-containing protein, partial [Candidatus Binatia bacterium]
MRSHRLRRTSPSSLLSIGLLVASAQPAVAVPPCDVPGSGWCVARRINGDVAMGELGFRFGEPLDADGDGTADIAAGSRFKLSPGNLQNGVATVWSGATGAKIREWDGTLAKGLFGHWVMPVPDLDGDRLSDIIVSAPQAVIADEMRGVLSAHSPKSGNEIWRLMADREEMLGWDMDIAGDQDGDGKADVFAGAPGSSGGRVHLVSGKDGSVLRSYQPATPHPSFGWYVASTADLDADGRRDLVVG